MNPYRIQLVTFFLSLFLFGCNVSNDRTVTVSSASKQSVLLDSLQKLDSLVLKYRAKNATGSIEYARRADKIAQALNTPSAREKAYNILGNAYSFINIDSGFYFYNKALIVTDSFNLADKKGKVLYNLGNLNRMAGNYEKSFLFIDSALKSSISAGDFTTMSNSLNSLGNFYIKIGEKVIARKLFDSAFSIAKSRSLYLQMGAALGNLARYEPDDKKSIVLSRLAISYLEKNSSSDDLIATILINIGYRSSVADSAIRCYKQAINMVSVDYAPEVIIGAYNNLAYCYLAKGDIMNAAKCIEDHALPVALKTNNIYWQSTVYDTYADILKQGGDAEDARVYKKKSMELKKIFRASVSSNLIGSHNN